MTGGEYFRKPNEWILKLADLHFKKKKNARKILLFSVFPSASTHVPSSISNWVRRLRIKRSFRSSNYWRILQNDPGMHFLKNGELVLFVKLVLSIHKLVNYTELIWHFLKVEMMTILATSDLTKVYLFNRSLCLNYHY